MRYVIRLMLVCCLASALHGQTASAPRKNTVAVQRPPASARPSEINRLSTAQRSALVNDKPANTRLPSFTASDRNGQPVAAVALPKSNHWIMIYGVISVWLAIA